MPAVEQDKLVDFLEANGIDCGAISMNGYTYWDIRKAVDEGCNPDWDARKDDLWEQFPDRLTAHVFDMLDWQSPEAFINADLDYDEEYMYFLEEFDDKRLTDKQRKELGYE